MNLFLHFWKKRRLGKAFQLFLTVWHPLRNNICMTMLLCDEITLLWITKIWPFWVSDSQNKTTTEGMCLWGFTANAQSKNMHVQSQKLRCLLFTINSGGLRIHTVDPCQLLSLGERFFLLTLIVLQLYICMYNRLMYRYRYIHTYVICTCICSLFKIWI